MNEVEEADLAARIADLVSRNPGQMRFSEYELVARTILRVRPAKTLVFGCGRDSQLWKDLADPGVVMFVEDQPKWAGDLFPVIITQYVGSVESWRHTDHLLALPCWAELAAIPWDLILVDGPRGDRPTAPGRLGPIAFSSGRDAVVAVHDVHRTMERELCARYFAGRRSTTVHHLQIFERPDHGEAKEAEAAVLGA